MTDYALPREHHQQQAEVELLRTEVARLKGELDRWRKMAHHRDDLLDKIAMLARQEVRYP